MTTGHKDIEATIMRLLEAYNKEGVPLSAETNIAADLNIDSADILNFVMEVEDEFDIDISVNELADVHTVAQLTELVAGRVNAS